jgi:peptidoglycan/xylan/chitin deacetylase (PgdA/CDA1 family)
VTAAKDAARTVLALLTCWGARISSARAGVALVYHRIGDTAGNPHFEILPAVSSDVLGRQLRHLRRRYRVVPATELLDAVRKRRRGERFPASITFDDDLASHLENAVPALQREGLPATFFLGGVSLREPHPLWWEDLQKAIDERLVQPDALPHVAEADLRSALARSPKAIFRVAGTIEQLGQSERQETAVELRAAVGPADGNDGLRADHVRSLVGAGFDVGFHTFRHDLLPGLSDAPLAEAMREGREELERVAGRPLDVISYPYGKADGRVAQAARKAGFTRGFTTKRTSVDEETDPLLIPRIPPAMSFGKTALRLARAVAPWS